ncbi:MAG: phosphoribosylglycinamide formyltransferase [Bacteroidetes bacterium]|nr:phosphoribosylglycinamide formyltransferase [Bacteroidota bacterium]
MAETPTIAIFASGNGTNAQNLAEYSRGKESLNISAIYCNNPDAYVLERARSLGIPSVQFGRNNFYQERWILDDLRNRKTDWIILAGFLWLIPGYLLKEFPNRIVNIHPALLPNFGGKGMYGSRVHEAVIASGVKESGITIHFVNENYDEGQIIFQAKCKIEADDTPITLANKIHGLEQAHFPEVVAKLISMNNT